MGGLLSGAVKAVGLPDSDTGLARQSGEALAGFVAPDAERLMMRLQDARTGEEIEAMVPAAAVRLLARVLAEMGEGRSFTLVPLDAELSTQQAAGIIGVSRPFFIKLLDQGRVPYRKVGEHRRVRYRDLLSYMESYQREATAALNEMSAEAERLGL